MGEGVGEGAGEGAREGAGEGARVEEAEPGWDMMRRARKVENGHM